MRKITLMVAAVAALFTAQANAQLVNDTEGYQRFEASFASGNLHTEVKASASLGVVDVNVSGSNDADLKGFELGYIKGINITTNMPLFLELGGNMTFLHNKNENKTLKTTEKTTLLNIAIPVNVAYKFAFSSSNFTVLPFVGPNFKFNLIGKNKYESDGHNEDLNFFDKDLDKENRAKRFQFGANIGAGVNIGKVLYLGYRFQPDLMRYQKSDDDNYISTTTQYVTVGINF